MRRLQTEKESHPVAIGSFGLFSFRFLVVQPLLDSLFVAIMFDLQQSAQHFTTGLFTDGLADALLGAVL